MYGKITKETLVVNLRKMFRMFHCVLVDSGKHNIHFMMFFLGEYKRQVHPFLNSYFQIYFINTSLYLVIFLKMWLEN